ncbi:TPA_asm: fusion protein [Melastoma malabathricum amalgavirus 1]|nr:TPA_asm: fusion protein [Melastoma malabathricum amalgavirus 1]
MSGVGEGSSGGHHGAPAIVPPAIPPAVGDDRLEKTLDEMQEEVDAVTAPLLAHHFPPGVFNVEAALMEGFSYKPFLKLIKKVAALHEQGILQQSIWEGTTKKFWLLHSMCTRKEFVTFARWLSTQEGQDAMFSHQRSVKLQKRASEKITPDQIAYVQVLDFQRQKYSAEVKETRVDFESDIAELQERLRLKRREMEEALKALDVKYLPASSYVEPEDEMVGKTALELYEQECLKTGKRMKTLPGEKVEYAKAHFGSEARQRFMIEFAEKEEHRDLLMRFLGEQVLTFAERRTQVRSASSGTTWLSLVESRLLRLPLPLRRQLTRFLPVGNLYLPNLIREIFPLGELVRPEILRERRQLGCVVKPALSRRLELQPRESTLRDTLRFEVLRSGRSEKVRSIPVSKSSFEAATRKIIGGGALVSWVDDRSMYRGGGNSSDALLLLSQASETRPGAFLHERYTPFTARGALGLPDGLPVPDGPEATRMKNFNNDATSGPFLWWSGVKTKNGLKHLLEEEMWRYYDDFATGKITTSQLPYLAARLGFRTKLITQVEALKRIEGKKPFGRAVLMMDALEQAASSPLYNVLSHITFEKRLERDCGFKNTIIRASSDWMELWRHVREAKAIVELDWSKFDRERPSQDLSFMVDVVVSCFEPRNERERKLLKAYKIMMRAALIDRLILLDSGMVIRVDGMVPSGSLWTGWIDTALNILYLKSACLDLNIPSSLYVPMCAGDDNLTLFWTDPGDKLSKLREILNHNFRAGIDQEDFLIHRPPFHVKKEQAIFSSDVNIMKGTSRVMEKAKWVEFDGELTVDLASGKSHRWEYRFKGTPKFLSFHWLPDGRPIRPASKNLEKLLWPEGVHKDIDEYEAALFSMVVDNPWNHHNVNQLLMRFIIVQQIRGATVGWIKPLEAMWYARFRPEGDEVVPFPNIAPWRRSSPHSRMEDYPEVTKMIEDFRDFVSGVTSLYARSPTGGVDAYKFMEIIRGESRVGEGQFGNDMIEWLSWLSRHRVTKYFKMARGFRVKQEVVFLDEEELGLVRNRFVLLREKLYSRGLKSALDYVNFVTSLREGVGASIT